MAQQRQDRRGEVQAATASATGLACFIFRFLRRPQEGKAELNETMANRYHLLREYVNTLENESQNRIYRAID